MSEGGKGVNALVWESKPHPALVLTCNAAHMRASWSFCQFVDYREF